MATLFEKVFNSLSNRDEIEALQKIKADLEAMSVRASNAEAQVGKLQDDVATANGRAAQALSGSLGNEDRAASAEASNSTLNGLLEDMKTQVAEMQQRNTLLQNISDTKSEQITFLQGELEGAKYKDYTVVAGDYWILIAKKVSLSLNEVLAANNATTKTAIYPGRTVCLPSNASSPTTTHHH